MNMKCKCGHNAVQHVGPGNACLYVERVSESETIVCTCRSYERAEEEPAAPEVDKYASDHADMAFMSQVGPPYGQVLSTARRMQRTLYIYEWAKQNKVMDGDWEVHHSLQCVEEAIIDYEAREH